MKPVEAVTSCLVAAGAVPSFFFVGSPLFPPLKSPCCDDRIHPDVLFKGLMASWVTPGLDFFNSLSVTLSALDAP